MKITRLIVLFALAFITTFAAADDGNRYEIANHVHFSLPSNWRRVSKSELEGNAALVRATGATLENTAQLAFQQEGTPLFSPPYITINVHRTGRLAVSDVDALLAQFEAALSPSEIREVEKKSAGIINNTRIQDLYYDEKRFSLGALMHSQLPDGSGMTAQLEIFFITSGYVQVNFYSNDNEFKNDRALFEQIANSVTIEPGFGYNPIGASRLRVFFSNLSLKTKGILMLALITLLFKGKARVRRRQTVRKTTPNAQPFRREEKCPTHTSVTCSGNSRTPITSLSTPTLAKDDPLLMQLRSIVASCQGIADALCFQNLAHKSPSYVLALDFQSSTALNTRQQILHTIREKLASTLPQVCCQARLPESTGGSAGISLMRACEQATGNLAKVTRRQPKAQSEADDSPIDLVLE